MSAAALNTLHLTRIKRNAFATYGRIVNASGAQECVALELPDRCIPAGTYTAERYLSPEHGCVVFRLIDVPGREYIELHIGCLPCDSKGCILLGTAFGHVEYADHRPNGKGDGITASIAAFRAFMANHPEQRFTLVVTDPPASEQAA